MKEELQERLFGYLDGVETITLETVELVKEQCPLLIEELLAWHFTLSLVWFCFGVVLVITVPLIIYKATQKFVNATGDDEAYFFNIFSIIPVLVGAVVMSENLEWLQITVAPRIFLLEYLKDLL